MDVEGGSTKNLEGPFSSHLYIGFAPANKKTIIELRGRLENRGVSCCLRDTNGCVQSSIKTKVSTSQKCLLFLTPEYLKDKWYQTETVAVIEKSERFCRDMVIILQSEELQEEVPERLREFMTIHFKLEKLNDEKFLAQFVDVIIREPNVMLAVLPKQNFGYGSAFGYFYGFLRLTLPEFRKQLVEETLKNNPDLISRTVKKMLIIMPESCFCAIEMESTKQIEFTGKYVVRVASRAGTKKRDYKSSLYKLIDHERQQEFYFVGEFATPLLTMYETFFFGLCMMQQDQLYAERDAFYFALKAILSHPNNAECNDQFKLLYWSDPETKKPNQLDLYNFLLPVLRNELMLERENERNPSKIETTNSIPLLSPNLPILNSFDLLKVGGSNPGCIYEGLSKYPMEHRPRGLCLIVNIANFDKGHVHLKERKGAERDAEILKKLFKDLHFDVQTHNDVNAETIELLFLTMHNVDHTNYDAFVCCILTHGKLGVIYTSDGKPVEILGLVEFLTDKNCQSLKGKPKMFFIQACQKGDPEPENGAPVHSISHDGSSAVQLARPFSQDMTRALAMDRESLPFATCATVEEVQERYSSIHEGNSSIQARISGIQEEISSTVVSDVELERGFEEDATTAPHVSALDETLPTNLKHKAVLVPGYPDFLMSYSTLPGSISYRDTQAGSLYIQALDECLRNDSEIDRALKGVSTRVRELLMQRGEHDGVQDRFQLPFHLTSGMDRLIFL